MDSHRVSGGCRAACVFTGLVLLPVALSAQTLPLPELPRETPPQAAPAAPGEGPGPTATEAPGSARPQPWDYRLDAGVGYDSNIDFQVADGPSSSALSPRGSLTRTFWNPRGQLHVGGTGSWIGYLQESDLSRFYADAAVDGSYRSSPATTWRGNASYEWGYSDSSRVLADQGVLLPIVPTNTVRAGLGVTRMLGQRTSFRVDGRFYRTAFDQQDAAAFTLVDGQSLRATAGLEQRFGLRNRAVIEYSLESALGRNLTDASAAGATQSYLTHYGSVQWSHLLSARSGLLLEAGGSYTPDAAQVGLSQQGNFFGGVSYYRAVRGSSVTLFARREVTPAFGLGLSRLENRFGLDAGIPIGQYWTILARGTYVDPSTPEGVELAYGTPSEAHLSIERRLGRRFAISAEGRYRRRSSVGAVPAIEDLQAGLFVSLLSPSSASSRAARPPRR